MTTPGRDVLTREEFMRTLAYTDDLLEPGIFSEPARRLIAHDAALRSALEEAEREREELCELLWSLYGLSIPVSQLDLRPLYRYGLLQASNPAYPLQRR